MRRYKISNQKIQDTEKIICNMCGKEISVKNNIKNEDVLSVEKRWGYPSEKDNEVHRFDLCEECYDKLVRSFKIPVEIE